MRRSGAQMRHASVEMASTDAMRGIAAAAQGRSAKRGETNRERQMWQRERRSVRCDLRILPDGVPNGIRTRVFTVKG
jgi:hypothetical protein